MTRLLLSLPLLLAVFLSPDLALIVLLTVLGIPVVLLLDSSLRRNTVLGVSFLLGCGIAHLLLLAMSALSIRWTRDSLLLGFVIVYAGTALLVFWRRRRESVFPTSEEPPSPVSVLLHLATVGLVFVYSRYVISVAQGSWERWTPLWRRDYWGIWGLKAKLFLDAKAIDWAPLEQPLHWSVHPDYPLLVPLLLDVVAIFRGGLNPIAIGSIYTAFAVALLLILRDLWSEELQRRVAAALSTLLMAPAALSIYVGLAEGPLIAYAGAGLLLLRRDLRSGGPGRITPLLLGFAALTKNEGLGLLVAVLLVMLLRPELRRRARRLWPGFALAGLWLLLRIQHGLSTDLFENLSPGTMAGRLLDPARWAQAFSVPSLENPLFWLALTLALALLTPESARREFFLLGVVGIQLLFFTGSYLISPHDLGWHVTSSWARLLAQIAVPLSFIGLLALWDAVAVAEPRNAGSVAQA